MPDIMDWPQGDSTAVVARALQELREGRLVVMPTESVYVAAARGLDPEASAALTRLKPADDCLTLMLGHAVEVFDWLPFFRGVGIRLARRFWPGPLTLVCGT